MSKPGCGAVWLPGCVRQCVRALQSSLPSASKLVNNTAVVLLVRSSSRSLTGRGRVAFIRNRHRTGRAIPIVDVRLAVIDIVITNRKQKLQKLPSTRRERAAKRSTRPKACRRAAAPRTQPTKHQNATTQTKKRREKKTRGKEQLQGESNPHPPDFYHLRFSRSAKRRHGISSVPHFIVYIVWKYDEN